MEVGVAVWAGVLSCDVAVRRAADRHRGLQDPSRRSAGPALPGALHPSASAHHGLPEGAVTVLPDGGGEELRFDMSAVSRATCGVCGPNLSTPSPAALAFWRYDAPLGQQDQRGEDCGSFPFPPREGERARSQ